MIDLHTHTTNLSSKTTIELLKEENLVSDWLNKIEAKCILGRNVKCKK